MPTPPPVLDLRALERDLADIDARFIALASRSPRLVAELHDERTAALTLLPSRAPGWPRTPDVVVRAGVPGAPDDPPRLLHVEWQTRAAYDMRARMLRYGNDLHVREGLPVHSLVVQAGGSTTRSDAGDARFRRSADGFVLVTEFRTLLLPGTPWRRLVDPARRHLAALVPAARGGTSRTALRASLRALAEAFCGDAEVFSHCLALHRRLAELHSVTLMEWTMTARLEQIELPEDFDINGPGLMAAAARYQLHHVGRGQKIGERIGLQKGLEKGLEKGLQKGREEGHRKGREEGTETGRRATLLEIAAVLVSDDELASLRAIKDVDTLAEAVTALVRR